MLFFFFIVTATTEIYTLSLHDALPILPEYCHRLRVKLAGFHMFGRKGSRLAHPKILLLALGTISKRFFLTTI